MRLVIKVGTSLIAPRGRIDTTRLRALVDQFDLSRDEYLIVSSGAIASGMSHLQLAEKPSNVPLMQACAAVGQSALMHTYEQVFFGKKVVAQLLLSSDNDELSALLARAVQADWLLLLTDVDGFYVPNGKRPRLLRTVSKLTPEMEALCSGHGALGRGGMRSKLRAAKMASEAGVHVAIVNGSHERAIAAALERKIGTYFPPKRTAK